MQKTRLKAGDLVRVRSGGPIMTAERVSCELQDPYACCVWFDERNPPHGESFKIPALELVDEKETRPERPG
jgi:uncharacterized protein YodC (DUF2158 family)